MQLAKLRVHLQQPIIVFGIGVDHQSEIAAHTEVVAARETQNVRKRGISPGQIKHGGAQTRGRAANVARDVDSAGLLEDHRGTRGHSREVHGPASLAVGFEIAVHVDQGERKFFARALEIDPAGIHLDAAEADRGRPRRCGGGSGTAWFRKPFGYVPIAIRVANEIQAGHLRDGAELQVAAKEALPAQPNRERLRPQKIFVAEAGIFAERDGLGFERGPPQSEKL